MTCYPIKYNKCQNIKRYSAGCSNALVPVGFSQFITIATVDSYITHLVDSDNRITRFYFNETSQMLNNSLCHIISLEVYRGKDQATEIRNDGFFTSSDGSIEVGNVQQWFVVLSMTDIITDPQRKVSL